MTDEERELIDATERTPRLDSSEPWPLRARPRASLPPPLPARARAATVPPPIPARASTASMARIPAPAPPPIPQRARAASVPPPIPLAAPATSIPPPIPLAAPATSITPPIPLAAPATSIPPPIPVRARATTASPAVTARGSSSVVVAASPALDEPGLDIDFTPTSREAMEAARVRESEERKLAVTAAIAAPAVAAASWPVVVAREGEWRATPDRDEAASGRAGDDYIDWYGNGENAHTADSAHTAESADDAGDIEPARRRLPILRWMFAAVCAGAIAGLAFVATRAHQQRDSHSAHVETSSRAAASITPATPIVPPPVASVDTTTTAPVDTTAAAPVDTTATAPADTAAAPPVEQPAAPPAEERAASAEPQLVATPPSRGKRHKKTAPARVASSTPARTATTKPARTATTKPARRARVAATSGHGTLMVSSKPPCEIVIDGVATVLTTPQRALKLEPGPHKVTLFNLDYGIDATIDIVIEANRPTKLIRDFTSQMARSAPRTR